MDNIILLQTRKRLTQTNERYIKCYYKDNNRREDARTTPCALSFCVYTEREKETTTTPKEPQRQCKRTSKRQHEQRGQKDKKQDNKDKSRTKKRKNRGKTRHKPYNRLTLHAHKSPTIHANHQANTNPHETPKPR